jgi:hypothetical protein
MLPLLETLRDDDEEYVRRSVANHLNDIAKDHPDLVANLATQWLKGADKNRTRLIRHACRTLIKQGHPTALAAFNLHPPKVELADFTVETPVIVLGESVEFSAKVTSKSKASQELVIDYLIHFVKANGSRVGKVFKWKKLTLDKGETVTIKKSHGLRLITTRRYYSGVQAISLRINGEDFGFVEFDLEVAAD